ncbi:hypothetical protein [Fodinibius sp. Rm-B-1B1-1]|uniref:hypothetical protein n=1 Tax=Fodinibius alkaliphilus TaxID=3140241 RepID=UPI00315AE148
MNINASWHKKHPMPKNPTTEQRIEWHLEHVKNCECRDIPEKLKVEMVKRNISFESKNEK